MEEHLIAVLAESYLLAEDGSYLLAEDGSRIQSSAVSFPVAWGTLGSGTSTPRAAMYRTSGLRDMHLQGKGLMQTRVQIDCYGSTYAEAISASRDIRETLEGYQGGPILGAFLESTRDQFADDAQLLHRVSLTFSVTHRD